MARDRGAGEVNRRDPERFRRHRLRFGAERARTELARVEVVTLGRWTRRRSLLVDAAISKWDAAVDELREAGEGAVA